jgi:protein-disulfide isomerase
MCALFSDLCYNIRMKMEEAGKMNISKPWYRKGWVILGLFLLAVVCLGLVAFISKSIGFYQDIKSGKSGGEFMPIGTPTAEMRMEQLLSEREILKVKEVVKAREGDPFFGPKDAEHEIVMFEDFGCPYCKMAQATITDIKNLRPDIKISLRDFPITELHPNSIKAAQASRCIWRQGDTDIYFKYRGLLFSRQNQHDELSLAAMAYEVGASGSAFNLCMKQQGVVSRINQSILDAESVGVQATPTMFVDGIRVEGVHEAEKILSLIE